MKTIMKLAAAALFTVSAAGAANAGGFGWGSGGHSSGGSLINLSPNVGVAALNGSPILSGNSTSLLSGILNGNAVANGNGILNNLLGGNTSSSRNSYSVRGRSHGHHRW